MVAIIVVLLVALLSGSIFYIDGLFAAIFPLALRAEDYMSLTTGTNLFQKLNEVIVGFGISLIVLKFIKKGIDTYVLWNGSDANEEPYYLVINFFKAMAVAVSFPIMYGWLVEISQDLMDRILAAIASDAETNLILWVENLSGQGLVPVILGLVYVICCFILYFQFIMRGIEILILRLGVPIACIGIMDNDGGVFSKYLMTLFKAVLSSIVQIAIVRISLGLVMHNHMIWGIGSIMLAMRTPALLAEFMVPTSSGRGGGAVNTAYSAVRLAGMAKGLVK